MIYSFVMNTLSQSESVRENCVAFAILLVPLKASPQFRVAARRDLLQGVPDDRGSIMARPFSRDGGFGDRQIISHCRVDGKVVDSIT